MRIAVSGTHASGKSTLIADYLAVRPNAAHLGDPFDLLGGAADPPGTDEYWEQLRISTRRLLDLPTGAHCIVERTPLDFLAYLRALRDLGRRSVPPLSVVEEAVVESALSHIDLLVVLPLEHRDVISAPEGEDLELRGAMNDALLDLVDASPLADANRVIEVFGEPAARLQSLLAEVNRSSVDVRSGGR